MMGLTRMLPPTPEEEEPPEEKVPDSPGCDAVLGPTAVLQVAEREEPAPTNARPLYTLAMRNAVICFTGFRKKDELTYLITLIHYMGGSIRKDMSSKVTHLIANAASGEKYRYASLFRVPVLARTWVDASWERRDDPDCIATSDAFINEHRLKVFAGARVCFVGFAEDESQHMADVLANNGGAVCQLDDPTCTHVVMANAETYGHSLVLSPTRITPSSAPRRNTPSRSQSTPKTSLYRRLSARLSGCRSSSKNPHSDSETEHPEEKLQRAREKVRRKVQAAKDAVDSGCPLPDVDVTLRSDTSESAALKTVRSHSSPEESLEKENAGLRASTSKEYRTAKDKREVFKNKTTNVMTDFVSESNTIRSPLVKSLCDLDSKEGEAVLFVPSLRGAREFESTTTISSGKKRSRNSTDSNIIVSAVYETTSPDKCEEGAWKAIKRLKIKDSFKFKTRPTIFKREKKTEKAIVNVAGDVSVEPVTPEASRPSAPLDMSVSPCRDDDAASVCSMNTSKQSGFFDISFASIRQSKTIKSASKLRRSVKSFTASFRGERKSKYERRLECEVSTPKGGADGMTCDLSPVNSDTVDCCSESLVFKTPQAPRSSPLQHRHSVCYIPSPTTPRRPAPQPRAADAAEPLHGLSLSVVDEHSTATLPDCAPRVQIVKAEWFWASVQNEEAQDEKDYLFKDYLDVAAEASRRSSMSAAPGEAETPGAEDASPAAQRIRKRKFRTTELKEALLNKRRTSQGEAVALSKRRSSVGDAVLLSISGNLLDYTPSPDGKQLLQESEVTDNVVRKLMSPRQQVFLELLQTERNYVGILQTIVTMFKEPLEKMTEEGEDGQGRRDVQPLLNTTELKSIFGNLMPIYDLHRRMLEELESAQASWSEEVSIGRLMLEHTPDMLKAYPPFVNFFENTKEMLQQCDRDNPRFHAFLKRCQSRPECGRQTLQELLIRPVQRLPSISLLIKDILKHTHKNNPDHAALESALAGLHKAMSDINEDKRKTENLVQMFDVYKIIEHCPPELLSSHRSFVSKCEVVELSKELSGRGDNLVLFLFTDTMEVCKKRSKTGSNGTKHPYRHISLMPLSTVKRVVDIRDSEDCHNVFALMCRSNRELKERLYSFMMTDEAADKATFLRQLCRQMANTVCKADADKFLACLDSHQLDIDTSDLTLGTLSKAFKFATRTRIKVGRALSFNKTPSKLKRAMSSMISSSSGSLTPASQLAQMRLASCNNISELGSNGATSGSGQEVLVAPLSVQPTRKATGASGVRRF